MPVAFVSLADMKERLAITDTTDDATLRSCIEAASRSLEVAYNQRFQPHTATRYLTADRSGRVIVDGLLSVTSLKTLTQNSSGTRTYGNTWATTDYDLMPYNAAADREPYTRIEMNPAGTYTFPTDARGVEVVGVWGYHLDTTLITTAAEAMDTSETGYDVTSGASFKALQTILADSEQMYVTGSNANTLTVERAVNGTTSASHNTAISLYAYRYPEPVVEATVILATRLFRRKDAPFGVIGSPEFGLSDIAAHDPDVQRLMRPYERWIMAVA